MGEEDVREVPVRALKRYHALVIRETTRDVLDGPVDVPAEPVETPM